MFDDPQKELKKLEERLLQTEEDNDFEQFYREIFEEFGPGEEQDMPSRSQSVSPQKKKPSAYADAPRAVAPKKKDKGIRNLLLIILLECLGILGVLLWWILRLI